MFPKSWYLIAQDYSTCIGIAAGRFDLVLESLLSGPWQFFWFGLGTLTYRQNCPLQILLDSEKRFSPKKHFNQKIEKCPAQNIFSSKRVYIGTNCLCILFPITSPQKKVFKSRMWAVIKDIEGFDAYGCLCINCRPSMTCFIFNLTRTF
jgi:hypothetical protein